MVNPTEYAIIAQVNMCLCKCPQGSPGARLHSLQQCRSIWFAHQQGEIIAGQPSVWSIWKPAHHRGASRACGGLTAVALKMNSESSPRTEGLVTIGTNGKSI
jgi:hypothetical protein